MSFAAAAEATRNAAASIRVLLATGMMAAGALQVSRISWAAEAAYRLPVRVWREAIDAHFPDSAWLRLDRDASDRLAAFKASRTLPSWEAALDVLLEAADAP